VSTFAILVRFDVPDDMAFEDAAVPAMDALRTLSPLPATNVTAFALGAAEAILAAGGMGSHPDRLLNDTGDGPLYPCREAPGRDCPPSYNGVCGDRLCARFESDDESVWRSCGAWSSSSQGSTRQRGQHHTSSSGGCLTVLLGWLIVHLVWGLWR
jgi:hypothetical protein